MSCWVRNNQLLLCKTRFFDYRNQGTFFLGLIIVWLCNILGKNTFLLLLKKVRDEDCALSIRDDDIDLWN